MKKLLAGLLFILTLAIPSHAQTTRDSVDVPFVNAGDHSWVTFYFGHLPNGEPGTTALIIQCAFNRAELITNFDMYGQQMGSQFFAVTCSHTGPTFVNGERVDTYTLNATPLIESLVMYGEFGSQNLTLMVNSATWTITGYGRGAKVTGGAQIAY